MSHETLFCLLALALVSSPILAAPATGDITAAACASCHGVRGEGNAQAGFPALASLPEKYFIKQIEDFRSGARAGGPDHHALKIEDGYSYYAAFMKSLAQSISPADAQTAARYFAAQPRAGAPAARVAPAVVARGKELAVNGAWDRQIPPCFKCHATDGQGVAPHFPPIAGQPAAYTIRQLEAWKTGARTNDPQQLMKATTALTDEEIRAVAEYLSTLSTQGNKP
ncbi:MAG: c-type cytochrome [Thiobacillus sp.]|nr:c-type cytochrome [Thiobacillus sp.]